MRHYECARQSPLTSEEQRHLAKLLVQSQAFDVFMSRKFTSVKRYGAEGSESLLVFFEWLLSGIGKKGVREVVVCMPHRGRLNLLTGLLGLKPQALFHKVCVFAGQIQVPMLVILWTACSLLAHVFRHCVLVPTVTGQTRVCRGLISHW